MCKVACVGCVLSAQQEVRILCWHALTLRPSDPDRCPRIKARQPPAVPAPVSPSPLWLPSCPLVRPCATLSKSKPLLCAGLTQPVYICIQRPAVGVSCAGLGRSQRQSAISFGFEQTACTAYASSASVTAERSLVVLVLNEIDCSASRAVLLESQSVERCTSKH